MFKSGVKNAAVFTPILASILMLALLLPAVLTPSTVEAKDIEAYALVQIPSQEEEASLKSSVISIFDSREIYVIIGCTQAQLTSLENEGYTVIEQCSGAEDLCVSQLAVTLNSLVPPERFVSEAILTFNYSLIDSNTAGGPDFGWIDIRETGTNTGIHCDDCGVTVPIGFTFNFDGNNYTTIGISSNGFLGFAGNLNDFSNDCIPNATDPNDAIFAFWDDLISHCTGADIYYETRYIGGDRVFIAQWVNNKFFNDCNVASLTFEAILFENSNIIAFQYDNMTGGSFANGSSATVGIENIGGNAGLQYSCDSPTIANELAILFCPGNLGLGDCVREAGLGSAAAGTQQPKSSPSTPSMPSLTPPYIIAKNLNASPGTAYAGEAVTITANMANEGDEAGGYTATLKINGKTEQTKIGAIDGHAAVPVNFIVSRSQPGTYTFDLGGQKGTFTVLAAKTVSSSPVSGAIPILIACVMTLCTIGVLIFVFRRQA